MNISPVFTTWRGHIITATPSPSGSFWKAEVEVKGKKLTFFSQRTPTGAFYKAREAIVARTKA